MEINSAGRVELCRTTVIRGDLRPKVKAAAALKGVTLREFIVAAAVEEATRVLKEARP